VHRYILLSPRPLCPRLLDLSCCIERDEIRPFDLLLLIPSLNGGISPFRYCALLLFGSGSSDAIPRYRVILFPFLFFSFLFSVTDSRFSETENRSREDAWRASPTKRFRKARKNEHATGLNRNDRIRSLDRRQSVETRTTASQIYKYLSEDARNSAPLC